MSCPRVLVFRFTLLTPLLVIASFSSMDVRSASMCLTWARSSSAFTLPSPLLDADPQQPAGSATLQTTWRGCVAGEAQLSPETQACRSTRRCDRPTPGKALPPAEASAAARPG